MFLPGLIPARAGTTRRVYDSAEAAEAHPRSRGDHASLFFPARPFLGSSPLARGPPGCTGSADPRRGLIPARAGTTVWHRDSGSGGGAHPRSRGDHMLFSCSMPPVAGSSPLARGPPKLLNRLACLVRLVPARAGTTGGGFAGVAAAEAHPRSRGDHTAVRFAVSVTAGSSPLARGPQRRMGICKHGRGLIPARAGTTGAAHFVLFLSGAHPRSRGDHLLLRRRFPRRGGSSPLARGPLGDASWLRLRRGLIPARAGTTLSGIWRLASPWAHPRSRGDHYEPAGIVHRDEGSSPLARGPPAPASCRDQVPGLIPARAGTTR